MSNLNSRLNSLIESYNGSGASAFESLSKLQSLVSEIYRSGELQDCAVIFLRTLPLTFYGGELIVSERLLDELEFSKDAFRHRDHLPQIIEVLKSIATDDLAESQRHWIQEQIDRLLATWKKQESQIEKLPDSYRMPDRG